MRTEGFALAAVLAAAGPVSAQLCRPSPSSNEARTFAIVSVPLAYTDAGGVMSLGGRVRIGLEGVYLPEVDRATATPTTCRPGKGPEHTDLLFAAPRPRLAIDAGGGFTLEGSWIPPVRLGEVKANLVGVAVAWTGGLVRDRASITIRAHGTFGLIEAPITCNDDAIEDQTSECYQGQRSNDSFHPNIAGLEAIVGWTLGPGTVRPYLGAGYSHLMPRFQVNFTNAVGIVDRQKVEVDLDRLALFGGLTWRRGRFGLTGEIYSTPSDAVTGRAVVRLGL